MMEIISTFLIYLAVASPDNIDVIFNTKNIVGLIAAVIISIPTIIFLVKWVLKIQRDFITIYSEENNKLRERQDSLEVENRNKDDLIVGLRTKIGSLENRLDMAESLIKSHERTIEQLNSIIERRGMKDHNG